MPTLSEQVEIAMRDANRYSGDGLPDEPVGKPLPEGDPASGEFDATKKQLREAFMALAGSADVVETSAAQAAADRATTQSLATSAQNSRDAAATLALLAGVDHVEASFADADALSLSNGDVVLITSDENAGGVLTIRTSDGSTLGAPTAPFAVRFDTLDLLKAAAASLTFLPTGAIVQAGVGDYIKVPGAAVVAGLADFEPFVFKDLTSFAASTQPSRGEGSIWHAAGLVFKEAAAAATDHDMASAGGVKFYLANSNAKLDATHVASAAILNAHLAAIAAVGVTSITLPTTSFSAAEDIIQPPQIKHVDFNGCKILGAAGGTDALWSVEGATTALPALASDLLPGSKTVPFADVHNMVVGKYFRIDDPDEFSLNDWRANYKDGQLCQVAEVVDATTVKVMKPLDPRGKAKIYKSAVCICRTLEDGGYTWGNGHIDAKEQFNYALKLKWIAPFCLDQMVTIGGALAGLQLDRADDGVSTNGVHVCTAPAAGYQYGVSHSACQDIDYVGCRIHGTRHGVTGGSDSDPHGGPTRRINLINCVTSADAGYSIDFAHGNMLDCSARGGSATALGIGGDGHVIDIDKLSTSEGYGEGDIAILASEMHGFNHSVKVGTVRLNGDGQIGGSANPNSPVTVGATSEGLGPQTVDGGLMSIEIGTLLMPNWVNPLTEIVNHTNRGATVAWETFTKIDRIEVPDEREIVLVADRHVSGDRATRHEIGRIHTRFANLAEMALFTGEIVIPAFTMKGTMTLVTDDHFTTQSFDLPIKLPRAPVFLASASSQLVGGLRPISVNAYGASTTAVSVLVESANALDWTANAGDLDVTMLVSF